MVSPFNAAWKILKLDPDREAVAMRNQARVEMGDNRKPTTGAGEEMQEQGITACDMCRVNTPQYNSYGMNLCNNCWNATQMQRTSPEQEAINRRLKYESV
jgi:hypothetical protein